MSTLTQHIVPCTNFAGEVVVSLRGLAECDETCNPGNCEVEHARQWGEPDPPSSPVDWDSPTWGNRVHVASNGSWIGTEVA